MNTVIICIITFRRPAQLLRLLHALAQQQLEGVQASITVVDNDPDGSAEEACSSFAGETALPVNYLVESEPGIVAARNRCAATFLDSNADLLAFIDDDEWPQEPTWLSNLVRTRQVFDADVVAGDVVSTGNDDVPKWATEILYAPSNRDVGQKVPVFYTGNLLISRHVLENLRPPFDKRFALTGASDYHFALRCSRAGYVAVHADAPVVEEFPRDRARVAWFLRRGFRSGAGHSRSHLIEDAAYKAVPQCVARAAARCGLGVALIVAGLFSFSTARLVRGMFRVSSSIGSIAGLLGLTHHEYRRLHTVGSGSNTAANLGSSERGES